MNTPICDFVRSYARQSALRLPCPLLELDAVRPPDSLALEIENRYLALTHTIPPKE